MKIRKTFMNGHETKVYIYENKKEESFMVAVPQLEWSTTFSYEEEKTALLERMESSLSTKIEESEVLSNRIFQWTREM
ncbi:YueH family protein [Falsibacillus albus]|uniref:YueH family protein n=1 Tax=Falsibacillus albus TaxID=2478915 RepID=A0A3L7K212_9BACI|nr:YueH family protein [Falsibacillus albus]RLQ97127.1 hypothetical protein D9X91_02945 [Falsibacillus albus]